MKSARMPPKKHQQQPIKQPFWFFMNEWKAEQEAVGLPYTLQHAQYECGRLWGLLSEHDKERYRDMSRQFKESTKGTKERYTSQGVPMSQIENKKKSYSVKMEKMKARISDIMKKAYENDALATQNFHLIQFNYFCKTTGGKYIPAELGMIRFNLQDGVVEKLHMFINPGKLPLGMAYKAKTHSEGGHQLPTPPDALGELDNNIILMEIMKFIHEEDDTFAPVFTGKNEFNYVENIIGEMCDMAEEPQDTIQVFPLTEMFFQLKQNTTNYGSVPHDAFSSIHVAQLQLERDTYEYAPALACDYHKDMGISRHCALSRAIRWAYLIADHCALDLGIDLQPGKHVPDNTDISRGLVNLDEMNSYSMSDFDRESVVSSSCRMSNITDVKMESMQNDGFFRDKRVTDKDWDKKNDRHKDSSRYRNEHCDRFSDSGFEKSFDHRRDRNKKFHHASSEDSVSSHHLDIDRKSKSKSISDDDFPQLGSKSSSSSKDQRKHSRDSREDKESKPSSSSFPWHHDKFEEDDEYPPLPVRGVGRGILCAPSISSAKSAGRGKLI